MATIKTRLERLEARHKQELCRKKDDTAIGANAYPPGWSPKSASQKAALESKADILFFGGAAGSLKTETMLVDAARESCNPNLRAIIFRQRLMQHSDIVDKSHRLYRPMGAEYSSSTLTWTFPSGATIRFAYSSTDRALRLRMRLASNPGQTGAAFHKRMFLRGGCPVHTPRQCAEPGKLYWDA